MSKKEVFVKEITEAVKNGLQLSQDAADYLNGLMASGDSGKPKFTENGKLVLKYMQANKKMYNNLFKAKEIGEGLGISSRTASGAMRKLVTDGYVEKIGADPVVYAITSLGDETNPDVE
jgi:DNA-binding MarR family transcriptional regulator